jgi:hypothetical protein
VSLLTTVSVSGKRDSEGLVRWHRAGFRRYWRWKSGNLGGRPQISGELRALIRRMMVASRAAAGAKSDFVRSPPPGSWITNHSFDGRIEPLMQSVGVYLDRRLQGEQRGI